MLISHCALYLPVANPPLESILTGGRTRGGFLRKKAFVYRLEGVSVALNFQAAKDRPAHLEGLAKYIALQAGDAEHKQALATRVQSTQTVLGVNLSEPVPHQSDVFGSLCFLVEELGGFMFLFDSLFDPTSGFLLGPMAEARPLSESRPEPNPDELKHQGETSGFSKAHIENREAHYLHLAKKGFRCSRGLPLSSEAPLLRPQTEIAQRLSALNALFHWAAVPQVKDEVITDFLERNLLISALGTEEKTLIHLPRKKALEHQDSVGWRLENMWALAWVLGFDMLPPIEQGQIPGEVIQKLVLEFSPRLDGSSAISTDKMRTVSEVAALEDLYYCAHNAVRSAQLGSDTVPTGFHPMIDGGTIHERRHALSWCLAPELTWDEVPLDT